ncbi:MAG: radical SAM protein [Acidobacteria bacterium]|nr:radical SAM protein [Acidobacteriota bacterium]
MPLRLIRVRRGIHAVTLRMREFRMIFRGLLSTDHPVLAHVIPIRRCNLSCTYCNEYDDYSDPVPAEVIARRLDLLAALGCSIVTLSGGEPLLHPELDSLIRHMRRRGIIASLITNGYLLTDGRIKALNRAGLDHMQISIDNVMPDEVSKKSLKVLDKKLQLLARHADFHVNINSVVGGGVRNPEDALVVGRRALELGFTATLGIIHGQDGQLRPLAGADREVYLQFKRLARRSYSRFYYFQDRIAWAMPNNWRCRAGARYLYICEDGLVHYCSQRRGYPAKPLEEYTVEDIRREYVTRKDCAPYCTVFCVHKVSYFDFWRGEQTIASPEAVAEGPARLVQLR